MHSWTDRKDAAHPQGTVFFLMFEEQDILRPPNISEGLSCEILKTLMGLTEFAQLTEWVDVFCTPENGLICILKTVKTNRRRKKWVYRIYDL